MPRRAPISSIRVQLAPWIYIQPDIQYIIRPRGRADVDDAFAVGFVL